MYNINKYTGISIHTFYVYTGINYSPDYVYNINKYTGISIHTFYVYTGINYSPDYVYTLINTLEYPFIHFMYILVLIILLIMCITLINTQVNNKGANNNNRLFDHLYIIYNISYNRL